MKLQILLFSFFIINQVNAQLDTIPPVITMNGADTVYTAVFMHYTDLGATAYDLKDGNVAVTKTSTVDTMHIGVFLVTYNADDAAGNHAIPKKRIVIIIDTIPPVLTIAGPDTIILCKGQSTPGIIDSGIVATDNYEKQKNITISKSGTCDINRYDTYAISYVASDMSGNISKVVHKYYKVSGNCIEGNVFFDKNKNCIYDSLEENTNQVDLNFKNLSTLQTTIVHPDNIGTFGINAILDTGNYLVKVISSKPYIKVTCSRDSFYYTHTSGLNNLGNVPISDTLFHDLSASFYPDLYSRWNTAYNLTFYLQNKGRLNIVNPKVELKIPTGISILGSFPAYSSIVGNTITWNVDTIKTVDHPTFTLSCKADTSIYHLNDTFSFQLGSLTNLTEVDTLNNYDVLKKYVVGSFDPNEKYCNQPIILKAGTTNFNYTVLFQNTGNAAAFDVVVKDTIDSRFDLNTFQITEASHRQRMFIKDNMLMVRFEEIYLPDSHANEPKSHGYFSYSVKLKKPLALNEEILNTAYIYFDNNAAIVTNTTSNKYALSGIKNNIYPAFVVYPNPATSIVTIPNYDKGQIIVYNLLGKEMMHSNSSTFDISVLHKGVYILKLNNRFTKLIKE